MTNEWEPKKYSNNEMINAVLNVAASISALADATNELLYGLKYSKTEGLSVSESIETAGKAIASAIESRS